MAHQAREGLKVQRTSISDASQVSHSMSGALLVIVSALGVLAFILVLFSDFIPLSFGGYADQRFLLVAVTGLLAVVPVIFFALKPSAAPAQGLVLLPTLMLCLAFGGLAAPFGKQVYAWVEPGTLDRGQAPPREIVDRGQAQIVDRGQAPPRALIWPLCSTPSQEQVKLTMRQPLNPKVSGASSASASLPQAMNHGQAQLSLA